MFVAGPSGDTNPRALWTHGVTHYPPHINLPSRLHFDIGLLSPHDYSSDRQASPLIQYEIVRSKSDHCIGFSLNTVMGQTGTLPRAHSTAAIQRSARHLIDIKEYNLHPR